MGLKQSVTLEEYDATLRQTVNDYYVHAMNDPNMSKEEAIQSTHQMAEAYLNSIDEFQAAQAGEAMQGAEPGTGEQSAGMEAAGGLNDGGEGQDGEGMDGEGMDGGM